MENERDNAFTSTSGLGGIDQSTDFGSPSSAGTAGSGSTAGGEGGFSQPTSARAREAVSAAGHRAAERVQDRIADQKDRATDSLEGVANSLRTASEQMPDENGLGRYMLQAATQVDNLASFLNNREVTDLFDEVEGFARRQPAVFIGGAFALGVLGARFLRSSRQNLDSTGARSWQSNGSSGPDDDRYGRSSNSMGNTGYTSGQTSGNQGQGYTAAGGGTTGQGYSAGSSGLTGSPATPRSDDSTSSGYSGSPTTPGHTSGTMRSPDESSGSRPSSSGPGYGSSAETGNPGRSPDYL